MADTTTTVYGWVQPEPGASGNTWGAKLNQSLEDIDTEMALKANSANAALSGTIALSATAITQSATVTQTRAMGTAPAGNTNPWNYLVTFTGDAGGTSDVRAWRTICEAQGANSIADVRYRYAGVNLVTSAGTTALAYGDHSYITVSGAGHLTSGRVYYAHYGLTSTGNVQDARCYEAGDLVCSGTGVVTNSVGLRVANIGHATLCTNAYGVQIANYTAATLTVGVEIATASGTGKWGIRQTGNANNALTGNLRIGSTTAPTAALDVTGAVLVSSTINKVTVTAPATSATLTLADGSSLVTSGANSITLTSTGATNVTLPTTGTLVAQSTATFTPTLTFGGGSTGMTGSFTGRYYRTGNHVTGYVNITLTAKGSSTGNMLIGNLPVTAIADNSPGSAYVHNMTSGVGDTHLQSLVLASSATLRVEKITTGSFVILTHSDFTDTSTIRVPFSYFV
jgi:hypothetical protein